MLKYADAPGSLSLLRCAMTDRENIERMIDRIREHWYPDISRERWREFLNDVLPYASLRPVDLDAIWSEQDYTKSGHQLPPAIRAAFTAWCEFTAHERRERNRRDFAAGYSVGAASSSPSRHDPGLAEEIDALKLDPATTGMMCWREWNGALDAVLALLRRSTEQRHNG